ncbi:sulfurtransferase complex subunit TusB [Acerihabitans sp. TG2]|uniref:sulfurtransferase complex subunit TusB n=1 Tax=Acerihabitans sp. TG2 TaxID=3096008 RepID=UPI002B22F263|nr:sulfurtransferase complex subunit TusB [Acerihabitans sp. TG2]MEA9390864.1 sulfurtransferase complex subunit TusB [Acerihabitans sp. TG2]
MLHTFSRSPFVGDLDAMLLTVRAGDDLLLMQDGVIAGLTGTTALHQLTRAPLGLFALSADIDARGLGVHFSDKITIIDYNGFVSLTVKHAQQMAW